MDKECCQRLSRLLGARSPVVSSEVDDWGSAVTLPLVHRDGENWQFYLKYAHSS